LPPGRFGEKVHQWEGLGGGVVEVITTCGGEAVELVKKNRLTISSPKYKKYLVFINSYYH
jgi:hypothetical protein